MHVRFVPLMVLGLFFSCRTEGGISGGTVLPGRDSRDPGRTVSSSHSAGGSIEEEVPDGGSASKSKSKRPSRRGFSVLDSANSISELRISYKRAHLTMRDGTIQCATGSFAWFVLDEGSGLYEIHVLLYRVVAEKPRLVLYIPPLDPHLMGITIVPDRDRITVNGYMTTDPKRKRVIAYYYPSTAPE
jgi:hypothetical protein